jgi:uncharacterized membrane protein
VVDVGDDGDVTDVCADCHGRPPTVAGDQATGERATFASETTRDWLSPRYRTTAPFRRA